MRYSYNGMAGFGKGSYAPPPVAPTAAADSWEFQKQLMEMKHQHEMEMMKLRLEMAQMQKSGVAIPAAVQQAAVQTNAAVGAVSTSTTAAGAAAVAADVASLKQQLDTLKRAQQVDNSGGVVIGSGGKSVEEALVGHDSSATHQKFTPTTAKKGLKWDDWRKLQTRLPANFNEEKYLANNPDVAAGVARGTFPSGAWHYVMHGSPNCAAGERHAGVCDKKVRSFQGWRRPNRRPGYLNGIFSNWNQRD